MGSKKVSAPPPRDYKAEMEGALRAQIALQPELLASERQYQPEYQKLQQEMMDRQMDYQLNSYGKAIPKSAELSRQFADTMSPVYGRMGEQAMGAYQQGLGADTMGLYNTMQRLAQEGLNAGYGLTPEMERYAQQSARAASTARGLTFSNQGLAQEVLNSYTLSQNRYQQSLANAQNTYGLGVSQFAGAMGTYGNQLLGQSQAYTPANLYGTAYNMSQGLGAQIFQPESQYNAGLITANRKEAMDAQIANAQSANALTSGLMSMGGAVLGGMATGGTGFFLKPPNPPTTCWVAREVYGTKDIKWEIFRDWLLNESPKWLCKLYIKHGEKFAKYISNKPILKSIIKSMMNLVVVPRLEKYKYYA
jgi:hypothetical protein